MQAHLAGRYVRGDAKVGYPQVLDEPIAEYALDAGIERVAREHARERIGQIDHLCVRGHILKVCSRHVIS